VGSEPGSSHFHLFSHFHHFTAEPQRLKLGTSLSQLVTSLSQLVTSLSQLGTSLSQLGTSLSQLGTSLSQSDCKWKRPIRKDFFQNLSILVFLLTHRSNIFRQGHNVAITIFEDFVLKKNWQFFYKQCFNYICLEIAAHTMYVCTWVCTYFASKLPVWSFALPRENRNHNIVREARFSLG
jgi:hypothetical protein